MPNISPVLQNQIAQLNAQAFWKEFTFSRNTFSPRPGSELELADNLVWLGNFAFALQLKQREGETADTERERSWFRKKVLTTATRQIRDTLRFLKEHGTLSITNERGHRFDIRGSQLSDVTKIIVFLAGKALPEDCWHTQYHVSDTAKFIHVMPAHDYLGILETLRVPKDIRDYFAYREKALLQLGRNQVIEPDIVGAFIADEPTPTVTTHRHLRSFVQDLDAFDISRLIGNLHDHIQKHDVSQDYYAIMLEFAYVPRSLWREVKTRFDLSIEAAKGGKFVQPFRLTFPASDCTFMIAPMHPDMPTTGPEGEKARIAVLENFTVAAKYEAKTNRAVGVLVSKDDAFFQIDWCRLDSVWTPDEKVEAWLKKYNPFRPVREKMMNSFFFTR